MTIGEQIRALRKEKGLSQLSLSLESDITPSTISHIEKGRTTPSIGMLYVIAGTLECPFEELLLIMFQNQIKEASEIAGYKVEVGEIKW